MSGTLAALHAERPGVTDSALAAPSAAIGVDVATGRVRASTRSPSAAFSSRRSTRRRGKAAQPRFRRKKLWQAERWENHGMRWPVGIHILEQKVRNGREGWFTLRFAF